MKLAIVVLLGLSTIARADDKATAEAAYLQARALEAEGKWAEACPLYLASYKADRQIGVLLYLANCHEQEAKLATAWGEFREAENLAGKQGDKRADIARERAEKLEPRLAKLVVKASALPGLVVKRGDTDISRLLGVPAPVDPGEHVIVASAPGYVEQKVTVTITGEGTTTTSDIPPLEKAPEIKTDPKVIERVVVQAPELDYTARDARRKIAVRVAIPGAVALGIGLGFGIKASRSYNDAKDDPMKCDAALVCSQAGVDQIDGAKRDARIADVGIVLGVAAIATGVVIYATAPGGVRKETPTKSTLRLVPTGNGAALIGRF